VTFDIQRHTHPRSCITENNTTFRSAVATWVGKCHARHAYASHRIRYDRRV